MQRAIKRASNQMLHIIGGLQEKTPLQEQLFFQLDRFSDMGSLQRSEEGRCKKFIEPHGMIGGKKGQPDVESDDTRDKNQSFEKLETTKMFESRAHRLVKKHADWSRIPPTSSEIVVCRHLTLIIEV